MSAAKNFALVVRIGDNEASIVSRGTKKAMIAESNTLTTSDFDFIGVARNEYEQDGDGSIGELVHTTHFIENVSLRQDTSDEALEASDFGGEDEALIITERNEQSDQEAAGQGQADPSIAAKVEKPAPVASDYIGHGAKMRLTPNGAKFSPVIEFHGVCVVDEVLSIVGRDVEYDKERVTPLGSLAKVEVKAKRYIEVTNLGDLDVIVLDARTTPAPEPKPAKEVKVEVAPEAKVEVKPEADVVTATLSAFLAGDLDEAGMKTALGL